MVDLKKGNVISTAKHSDLKSADDDDYMYKYMHNITNNLLE